MPTWLEFAVLAVVYVGTGGTVALEWGKKHHFLTGLAILISLGMSGYFWRDRILDKFGFDSHTEKPKEQPNPPGSKPPEPIPTNTPSENEQKLYFEAIRCLYSACDPLACMSPFKGAYPSSAMMASLESAAANAQTSPACKKPAPPPPQEVKPVRIPDCGSREVQQSMLPVVARWFDRAATLASARTGHAVHTQNTQIISSYSTFAGLCNVMAIGTLVDGNRVFKFPSDGLVVEVAYDKNGSIVAQTTDGVK